MDFSKVVKWTIGGKEVKTLEVGGQIYWKKKEAPSVNYFYVEDCSGLENSLSLTKQNLDSPDVQLEYSTDGQQWQTWATPYSSPLSIAPNSRIYLRGTNERFGDGVAWGNIFNCTQNYNVSGDLTTLLDPNGGVLDISQKDYCFVSLFQNSTTLINAKDLVLTSDILGNTTYGSMFIDCVNMISAPKLLAKTLFQQCYGSMFSGCVKLSEIEVGATNWVKNSSIAWVREIAPTGNFIMPTDLQIGNADGQISIGEDGIPQGWTVNGEVPIVPANYFYVEDASGSDNTLRIKHANPYVYSRDLKFEYSFDGQQWQEWQNHFDTPINFKANSRLYLRGTNETLCYVWSDPNGISREWNYFHCDKSYNIGGDITCLLQPNGRMANIHKEGDSVLQGYKFKGLFSEEKETTHTLINAKDLVLYPSGKILSDYDYLFSKCQSLESAPVIRNVDETTKYYGDYIFDGCSKLNKIEVQRPIWDKNEWYHFTYYWVQGVAPTGVFVKPKELVVWDGTGTQPEGSIPIGTNGIPAGWEIIDK